MICASWQTVIGFLRQFFGIHATGASVNARCGCHWQRGWLDSDLAKSCRSSHGRRAYAIAVCVWGCHVRTTNRWLYRSFLSSVQSNRWYWQLDSTVASCFAKANCFLQRLPIESHYDLMRSKWSFGCWPRGACGRYGEAVQHRALIALVSHTCRIGFLRGGGHL